MTFWPFNDFFMWLFSSFLYLTFWLLCDFLWLFFKVVRDFFLSDFFLPILAQSIMAIWQLIPIWYNRFGLKNPLLTLVFWYWGRGVRTVRWWLLRQLKGKKKRRFLYSCLTSLFYLSPVTIFPIDGSFIRLNWSSTMVLKKEGSWKSSILF